MGLKFLLRVPGHLNSKNENLFRFKPNFTSLLTQQAFYSDIGPMLSREVNITKLLYYNKKF